MKYIILETGQNGYCLMSVPERFAEDAHSYQMEFDKWLMDRSSDHGYWRTNEQGERVLAYDPPDAFAKWLNEFVLSESEKVSVLPGEMPVLHF